MELVKPTPAPTPKTRNISTIGILTASFFVILAVTQLFTFEQFAEALLSSYAGIFDSGSALIAAACIATLEIAALPFLLAMPLSPAGRAVSMAAGWLSAGVWMTLSLWSSLGGGGYTALFGATVDLPGGWWTVCFAAALGVLVTWVSWGMWPRKTKKS